MANALCGTTCGAASNPPSPYHLRCDPNAFRRFGFPYFGLVACNTTIADPTDLTAWQALVTSGEIRISPKGRINSTAPNNETSQEVDPCVSSTILTSTYDIQFASYQTASDDAEYWADILANHRNYGLFWFDCEQNIYLPGEYVDFMNGGLVAPVGMPGFEFTVSSTPHQVQGDGRKVRWEITMQVELDGSKMVRKANLAGLFDALLEVPA